MGRRQGRRAARATARRLRRRPRPRRRGRAGRRRAQRLGADRRLHRARSCEAAGTDVVLDDLTEFPAWLDEHVLDLRLAALEERPARARARCWSPSAAAPTARSCWRPRSGRSAPTTSPPRRRTPTPCRRPSATRPATFARGARRPGAHPGDPRDGARGLPRQRRRPLLLLQGRAARRARPAGRRARAAPHVATGTNADDARGRLPARHPRPPPSGARSPRCCDAGLTKEQVRAASRRWGLPTWDKPAAACLSSRIAYGIEVTPAPAGPRRARRGGRTRALLDAARIAVRDLRVRDLGERGRRSRSTPGRSRRRGRRSRRCSTPSATPASTRPSRPARLPVRLDERAARRPGRFR